MDTCSVKMFLPGITATGTLEMASTLCGQAPWKVRGQDHATRHDVATPHMIRQLPAAFAPDIRSNCAPVIAGLLQAWRNPAYRRARSYGPTPMATEAAQHPAVGQPHPVIPDHVPAEWLPDDGTTSCPWS